MKAHFFFCFDLYFKLLSYTLCGLPEITVCLTAPPPYPFSFIALFIIL